MENYTKGEWKVDKKHIIDESGRTLALLIDGGYEEMEANANLIAASPRMITFIEGLAMRGNQDAVEFLKTLAL